MLRGPQTAAELRTRAERLYPFASVADVEAALTTLAERELALRLPRRHGERGERWTQLLGGEPSEPPPAPAAREARLARSAARRPRGARQPSRSGVPGSALDRGRTSSRPTCAGARCETNERVSHLEAATSLKAGCYLVADSGPQPYVVAPDMRGRDTAAIGPRAHEQESEAVRVSQAPRSGAKQISRA